MVAWLSGQPPEVWLWFAGRGNWDTCIPLFIWMVERRVCDAAVVASLFWEASPEVFAEDFAADSDGLKDCEYFELIRTILLAWPTRPPGDVGLKRLNPEAAAAYRANLTGEWGGIDPLGVPDWLFGPFGAREPEDVSHRVAGDGYLSGIFFYLGMWFGDTPPARAHWQKNDEPAAMTRAERRLQIIVGLALISPSILLGSWYLYRGLGAL